MKDIFARDKAQRIYMTGQLENDYILYFLKKWHLTVDTASIITYVNAHPGTSQKKIAAYLHKQPATITNMIKRLERRLLLIRRNDARDSREKQVFLLKDGLNMVAKINKPVQDLNQFLKPCLDHNGHVDVERFSHVLAQKIEKLPK